MIWWWYTWFRYKNETKFPQKRKVSRDVCVCDDEDEERQVCLLRQYTLLKNKNQGSWGVCWTISIAFSSLFTCICPPDLLKVLVFFNTSFEFFPSLSLFLSCFSWALVLLLFSWEHLSATTDDVEMILSTRGFLFFLFFSCREMFVWQDTTHHQTIAPSTLVRQRNKTLRKEDGRASKWDSFNWKQREPRERKL